MKQRHRISPFSMIVAFVAVALVGLSLVTSLTVKLSPSRNLPRMSVNFRMQGNSARIVEMEATSKLEAMLARISGVKNIYSTSSNNQGSITLELDKHTSMDLVRFEASNIIRQTWPSLPKSVSYPTINVSHPDEEASRPFLIYNIDATVAPATIQQYAEENIKPQLAQIAGIYKIDVSGATPLEWHLEYDIAQLDAAGVSIEAIREAIKAYNEQESPGMALIDNDGEKRFIRLAILSNGKRAKGFHPEDIYIPDNEGNMICLNRLVTVKHQEHPPSSYYRINGLNSIYISLTSTNDANQLRLSRKVNQKMASIKSMLPLGYEIHIDYDATEHINEELDKIYIRTAMTILILLLFVSILTLNIRYLLLIVLSLFFNITIAVIFYYLLKLEIQIYSLAGITISLSLIIDNTIIMTDHYLRNHDLKAFLSMLAATLTTVGALAMIFFLDEKVRLNLQDFAAVMMINLLVSLAVSLLFVPAAADKMNIKRGKSTRFKIGRIGYSPKRNVLAFNRLYGCLIHCLLRFKAATIIFLIFAFGLPLFLLPDKIEGESNFAKRYNSILTSQNVKEKIRPIAEKFLGGTLRLFAEKVSNGGYFKQNDETVLYITASMPNGTTIAQMNHLIQQMESFLTEFKEIRQFQTSISNARNARINVFFTKEAEHTGFPYTLKSQVISKALTLGGGSWGVYGLQDNGFSNDVRETVGDMRVQLYGYNYDDLYVYADTLRRRLESNRRINDVTINSQFSWYKDDYREYIFNLDKEIMAAADIQPYELYAAISPVFVRDMYCGYVSGDDHTEDIVLSSVQSHHYDLWELANLNRTIHGRNIKTGDIATIQKTQMPQSIAKENQQYVLCIQYAYIGSSIQGRKFLEREIERFNEILPLGYSVRNAGGYYFWTSKESHKQYLFLAFIILIIFFITSILFNSLKQPFAILFVIPVSYIGVFLTFYLFKLNFDSGGFAAFVLLCGITVNASIYIVNEYNRIKRHSTLMNPIRAYIKAWNIKIIPILLTILSTIIGFIPFMAGLEKESFWYPLAAGTIGGLIMSLIGIFIYLPIFLIKRKNAKESR